MTGTRCAEAGNPPGPDSLGAFPGTEKNSLAHVLSGGFRLDHGRCEVAVWVITSPPSGPRTTMSPVRPQPLTRPQHAVFSASRNPPPPQPQHCCLSNTCFPHSTHTSRGLLAAGNLLRKFHLEEVHEQRQGGSGGESLSLWLSEKNELPSRSSSTNTHTCVLSSCCPAPPPLTLKEKIGVAS